MSIVSNAPVDEQEDIDFTSQTSFLAPSGVSALSRKRQLTPPNAVARHKA